MSNFRLLIFKLNPILKMSIFKKSHFPRLICTWKCDFQQREAGLDKVIHWIIKKSLDDTNFRSKVRCINMIRDSYILRNIVMIIQLSHHIEHNNQMAEDFEEKAALLDPGKTKTIGNYVIGKTLGKGTFGKVKAATHIPTGQKVAVKILQKQKIIDVADVQRVSRQIHILKLIRHPSIIQLYEIIETPKQLFLIMEYMECGELFDYIVKCKKIPEDEACAIFQQIVGGIEYIHRLNIVHRDLKPQNLLIDYDKTVRIVDFGLSNTYRKEERLKTACGSPCYAAPEMIQGKNRYEAILVDIWSCGVILYAMLCGCLPFEDPQTSKLYQKILAGEYKVPKTLSDDAKDLLSKILTVDPTKRYRIDDIRKHKWWQLSPNRNTSSGIIVGYHRIPIDQAMLDATVKLGFEHDFTKKCIEANRHNDATTTYYLLLKKFVRDGGISKAYLGSKFFDSSLIEPVRKIIPQNPLFDQTAPAFSPKVSQGQRNVNSQPGIPRKNYYLSNNNSLDRKARQTVRLDDASIDKSKYRQLYTPSQRIGHSLRSRPERTISVQKTSQQPTTMKRQNRQTVSYDLKSDKNDAISRKYKESYGVSLISKSKEKDRDPSKRRSLKKYELSQVYEKAQMNQTIVAYSRNKKTRSSKIGADKGFQNSLNTIDNIYKKPYMNRRFIYH